MERPHGGFPPDGRQFCATAYELLINLPKDWNLSEASLKDEKWYWPIRMLLATAYFPIQDPEVWLVSGTTLMDGKEGIPFAENTDLRGEILLFPGVFAEDSFYCRLPSGEEVNFYQVIPLYREEVQYKLENGFEAFVDLCPDESLEVINLHRLNVITQAEELDYDPAEMDDAETHLKKIKSLNLPYGTTQMRDEDGAWYEVTEEDEEEA